VPRSCISLIPLVDFDIYYTLFRVRRQASQGCTHLYPTRALQKLVSGLLPRVVLSSLSRSAISTVLNNRKDTFLVTGNAIDTWKALCDTADTINSDLRDRTPSERPCQCNNTIKEHVIHHCEKCFYIEFCRDMRVMESYRGSSYSVRICQRYINPRPKHHSAPVAHARANLRGLIKMEQASIPRVSAQQFKDFTSLC
jgi:hypothetical protein